MAADLCASITQTASSSWTSGGADYTQVAVSISATSATVTALSLAVAFPSGVAGFDSVWNVNQQSASVYTLPAYVWQNGGIKSGTPYSFGYIVKSKVFATLSVNNAICGSTTTTNPASTTAPTKTPTPAPTPAPTAKATPAPTPAATPAPTPAPTKAATPAPTPAPAAQIPECSVVFVVDSYITRTGQSTDAIRAKYLSYFADTQKFYLKNFNLNFTFAQMYFEPASSSFTTTTDANELLDSFHSALVGNFFPGLQQGACQYHLITGRQPYGIGGLSFIGTACDNDSRYNNGFTVDGQSAEDATMVVRRLTHELGHGFGGEHFDWYSSNPLYSCDFGASNADARILRSASKYYQYLDDDMFFTNCTTRTIKSTLPSFKCLYSKMDTSSVPTTTFYDTANLSGQSLPVPAFSGVQQQNNCFNIAYPLGSRVSSFKAPSSVKGIKFYTNQDCLGDSFVVSGTTSNYIGDSNVARTVSFSYIL